MVGLNKTIKQTNKTILKNIYLSFFYGAKIGIIGLNGAGKSTLLKIIAGIDNDYQGDVVWAPGYSVGYLPQDPPLDDNKTVLELVKEGVQEVVDALEEYEEINKKFGLPEYYENEDKMNELFARQAEVQGILDSTDAWNLETRLNRAMAALNLPPADQKAEHLSGGERRRVALCRLLLKKPDVLLLDEPTNHLDAESIDWLEQHLNQYEGTVIAVTHDRYFLDDVAGWILELDRGEGIPWKGNYSSWLDQKTKRMAQEEKAASKRRKTLERELEWVRMAPKARQAKGKALEEYEEINKKFGLPEYYENEDKMNELFARQAEVQGILDSTDAWNLETRLNRAMAALNLPPADQKAEHLSGGERRRVALCRLLLKKPDVLLLDEPTNHLDAESIDWLEQHLNQYEGTVIAVTHDRYFLDDVAGWILELDRGEGIPWKGNYSSWLDQKTKRMAQEEKAASKRRKTLERELEWVRMAPKARQAKGKARLNSYDRLLNEDQKEKEQHLEIFIPNGPRLGNNVIEAQGISKSFGEKVLYKDLTFTLPPAGIIGVIGPNGVGKTTLFRLIMGLETPDSGTFSVGETVKLAYVDQQHKDIDPTKSVYEVVSQGNELMRMGGREINARAYLSRFNFAGADQEKKCGVLSGGERNRLQLALALKQEGNVLLLDEPTNDIDVNTLRALEEGLEAFAGCAVVISHDRWFLDRICTHILAFEGDGNVFFFDGNYSDYEVNKAKRLGIEEPKRIRYRKFDEQQ